MMCRFAKCFVSFVLASLLSFVSLVPCFAEVINDTVNTSDSVCTVAINAGGGYDYEWDTFLCPSNTWQICDAGTASNGTQGIAPTFWSLSQFMFEEDKTLYWNIYPTVGLSSSSAEVKSLIDNLRNLLPTFYVGIGYVEGDTAQISELTVERVALGNANIDGVYSNTYRVTIPALAPNGNYNNNFYCYYPSGVVATDGFWTVSNANGYTIFLNIDMFQFVDTSDAQLLAIIDQILAEAQEANLNLSNILTACNNIIVQLEAMGADIEVIREMMATLVTLSQTQINLLTNIDTNVEAIYYFLTQALKSESEDLSAGAAEVGGAIDNNDAAETYYQTSMQGSYESLDLENFSFGGIGGALELVGTVFSDIWAAWGEYSILFTYPLILGVALLVIGRLSKHGGGNSSRNSEHKGGEGGA